MDTIIINSEIHLSPPTEKDAAGFVKYLNEPEISDRTLTIPYPYSMEDALWFINLCAEKTKESGRIQQWQIRNKEGESIGGIGLHNKYPVQKHRDEVGYWLAKPFWGKGIMTRVLQGFCGQVMPAYGLVRLEAPIFDFNKASQRVAEKCGFVLEGRVAKAYLKNGHYVDGVMYALVK